MAMSGHCLQRGRPNHAGCTYEKCTCDCHGNPKPAPTKAREGA